MARLINGGYVAFPDRTDPGRDLLLPDPRDPRQVEWKLRYGHLERADRLWAASVIGAYKGLIAVTRDRRQLMIAGVRAGLSGDREGADR